MNVVGHTPDTKIVLPTLFSITLLALVVPL